MSGWGGDQARKICPHRCSAPGVALDLPTASNFLGTRAHTKQANVPPTHAPFADGRLKTSAIIAHLYEKRAGQYIEMNAHIGGLGVFAYICDRFMYNSQNRLSICNRQ